jgi:hypothetical protein
VYIQAQVSLNGSQARILFITSSTNSHYIGLGVNTESYRYGKTEEYLHEPTNPTRHNIQLKPNCTTFIELVPKYAGPNAVRAGGADLVFPGIRGFDDKWTFE